MVAIIRLLTLPLSMSGKMKHNNYLTIKPRGYGNPISYSFSDSAGTDKLSDPEPRNQQLPSSISTLDELIRLSKLFQRTWPGSGFDLVMDADNSKVCIVFSTLRQLQISSQLVNPLFALTRNLVLTNEVLRMFLGKWHSS